MYPLKVVLVGCTESIAPEVRHQLVNHGAAVEAEYPDVQTAAAVGVELGGGE